MSAGGFWAGNQLFLGRTAIGKVVPHINEETKHVAAVSLLPGAKTVIGLYENERVAMAMVEKSADSRMKAMLDGSVSDVAGMMEAGRKLRKVARVILHAGVWTCDRPTYAQLMFASLRRALEVDPEHTPKPLEGVTYNQENGQCSAFEIPDDGEVTD